MTRLVGTKLKMTSMFKNGRQYGVTPIKLSEKADIALVKAGSLVMVSGISKGKGFAGGVKRWHFKGGPATHGQKNRHRAPGSIGNTTPQRVLPGRHMAGHMGMVRKTAKNIPVLDIDADKRVILLNGSVPGPIGREMEIRI
jgi:large subunit ribosomal protein L3